VSDAVPPLDLAAIALAGIGVVVVLAVLILLVSVRRGSRHEAGS
jgi:Na+-transporting methylmalonyl-CoA/oxaloacetate decarboxylase gamma subunit